MAADLSTDPFLPQRLDMVASQLRRRGLHDERVLAAMERVPRHEFVPQRFWNNAYADDPVPIGEGQTISQPYMVGSMLESLEVAPDHRILEIGTGTGYQAALLAELAGEVVTIERHAALAETARQNLEQLGYRNVTVIHGDGTEGWPQAAPYNRIIVAAASPQVPTPLFEQLAEDGRLIIPVGSTEIQELLLVRKKYGHPFTTALESCRFVPLIGSEGFRSS